MSFGKKQPQVKTQSETENQQIGRQANQYIIPAMQRANDLSMNSDKYRKQYIDDYFTNSASWNDAQRNMRRQLANATANNYAATHGGYSSAGSKYYDDVTRGLNDYNARLWDQGVKTGDSLWQNDLNAVTGNLSNMNTLHGLAAQGDAIDAYNQQLKEANKRWWTEPLAQIGNAVESMAPGWWKLIGTGMKAGANAASKDYSDSLARLSGQFGGTNDPTAFKNSASDFAGLMSSGVNNWMNWGGLNGSIAQNTAKLNNLNSQTNLNNAVANNPQLLQTIFNNTNNKDTLMNMFKNGQISLDEFYRILNGGK